MSKSLGQLAYEGYLDACGGKSFNNEPLPTWEQMQTDPKRVHLIGYWESAGSSVARNSIIAEPRLVIYEDGTCELLYVGAGKALPEKWRAVIPLNRRTMLALDGVIMPKLLAVLNEALALDPEAVTALFHTKVPCTNDAFLKHPRIVVGGPGDGNGTLSITGLLNGLFEGVSRLAKSYPDPESGEFDKENPGLVRAFIETVLPTVHAGPPPDEDSPSEADIDPETHPSYAGTTTSTPTVIEDGREGAK